MSQDYFYLHMQEDDGGIASSPEDNEFEFLEDLSGYDELPFKFILSGGPFQDYLLNDLSWPMFSEKFRKIAEPFLVNHPVQWITAKVEDSEGREHISYVLKFNETYDVLDKNKTIFSANDFVVKACLSLDKIKELEIFPIPGSSFRIIVSKDVKEEIERNGITGVYFSKVPVA